MLDLHLHKKKLKKCKQAGVCGSVGRVLAYHASPGINPQNLDVKIALSIHKVESEGARFKLCLWLHNKGSVKYMSSLFKKKE